MIVLAFKIGNSGSGRKKIPKNDENELGPRGNADRAQSRAREAHATRHQEAHDRLCTVYTTSFFSAALAHTGLKCKPPLRTTFGEWTFDFSEDVTSKEWDALLPVMISNLYRLS